MSEILDAIRRGDEELLSKKLVSDKSNVRFLVHKEELLNTAASFGHVNVVKLLISADIITLDQRSRLSRRTALHEACAAGSVEIVAMLLEYLSKRHNSAADGSSAVDFVDAGDRESMTAVHVAAFQGELECLKLLSDAGANLVMKDKRGMQPIHWCAQRDHANIVRYLYQRGVDIEAECNSRKTPAHYAAQFGSLKALRCLVERNCDLSLGDIRKNQPIHLAAGRNHTDCLRFIVSQGVGKEVARADGRRPSHLAAQHNANESLHWLLEAKADPNAKDASGNTPGHYANEGGHAAAYNCLLHHGADPEETNNNNEDHSQSARKAGHPNLMEKALANEITCDFCTQKSNRFAWEQRHIAAPVMQAMDRSSKVAYTNPLGAFQKDMKKHAKLYRERKQRDPIRQFQTGAGGQASSALFLTEFEDSRKSARSARDLTGKYYGEYVDAL